MQQVASNRCTCVIAGAMKVMCTPTRTLPDLQYWSLLSTMFDSSRNWSQPQPSLANFVLSSKHVSADMTGLTAQYIVHLFSAIGVRGNGSSIVVYPDLIFDRNTCLLEHRFEKDRHVLWRLRKPVLDPYCPACGLITKRLPAYTNEMLHCEGAASCAHQV